MKAAIFQTACWAAFLAAAANAENSEPWAQKQIEAAGTHGRLARMSEGAPVARHQQASIDALARAVEFLSKGRSVEMWANAQNQLGLALLRRAESCPLPERVGILGQAEDAFRASLEVYTREKFPLQFAAAMNNLGIALQELSEWPRELDPAEKTAYLEGAGHCYLAAIGAYTDMDKTEDVLRTRMNLVSIAGDLASYASPAEKLRLLSESAKDYEGILADPACKPGLPWRATVQANLAACLLQLAETDGNNLPAIGRANEVLHGIPANRLSDPVGWARVQALLGLSKQVLAISPGQDKFGLLAESIRYFDWALFVLTRDTAPLEWAGIWTRRGVCTVLLSQNPALAESRRGPMLIDGLIASIEGLSARTDDPEDGRQAAELIAMLQESAAAKNPKPMAPQDGAKVPAK